MFGKQQVSKNSAVVLPPQRPLFPAFWMLIRVRGGDNATILMVEVSTTHMRPKDNKDGRRDLDLDMKHILLCVR